MRKIILSLYLLIIGLLTFAQTDWIKKEVGSKIFVSFPDVPSYKLVGKAGMYSLKTENNLLLVLVQYEAIPNYAEFVKLPDSQQTKVIDVFLDNTVKGFLTASGNEGGGFSSLKIGKYKGRQTSFSSINPSTGENTKNFCKILYAFNKVYTFQCKCLKDDSECETEKNIFINSITSN